MESRSMNPLCYYSDKGIVSGYALYWDTPSYIDKIGKTELFKKGSLKQSRHGVISLFQHEQGRPLGNTKNNTLKITEDDKGLFFELKIPESEKTVRELAKRGDLTGASICFTSNKEDFSTGVREIEEAVLDEISLVMRPCHQSEITYRSQDKREHKPWGSYLWTY